MNPQAAVAEEAKAAARVLRVGGFTPFTNLDFPGKLAAVVFVQGCPWRCRYCHNPHLQPRDAGEEAGGLAWPQVVGRLAKRRGLLDAVVFSGGEPCIDAALPEAMAEVRALGFAVGLHTAGIYPRRLEAVLPRVDWVGFDVKAPLDSDAVHERVVGVGGGHGAALAGLQLVLGSGVAHEVRTTVHPALLSDGEVLRIGEQLAASGVRAFALQVARPVVEAEVPLQAVAFDFPSVETLGRLRALFSSFVLRRA